MQKVLRKGPQLLRGFPQPLQHGVRVHVEERGGTANAQALSEAADHMHDEVDRDALAMEERPVGLQKVPFAGRTVELTPRATAGMAVSAQVAQPQPAAIATASMGTEVSGGVHRARATVRRGHRLRW